MRSPVTLLDVATAANVSKSTAANVFNRPERVRPELRARVEAAAAKLGYTGPDPRGRLLSSGKVHAIGIVSGSPGLSWIFSDLYMLALRPDPIRVEVGEPFALIMNVCTKGGEPAELVGVDATLSEQKHGMTRAATLKSGGEGRYRVEGLLFDTVGSWEVAFDVRSGGEVQRLTHDFVVK